MISLPADTTNQQPTKAHAIRRLEIDGDAQYSIGVPAAHQFWSAVSRAASASVQFAAKHRTATRHQPKGASEEQISAIPYRNRWSAMWTRSASHRSLPLMRIDAARGHRRCSPCNSDAFPHSPDSQPTTPSSALELEPNGQFG
jgi:hypothetical protein